MNCRYQSNKMQLMVKHIKLKHGDALTNPLDSSGTEAKISSESSEDEGTSGVDENDVPDGVGETTGAERRCERSFQ